MRGKINHESCNAFRWHVQSTLATNIAPNNHTTKGSHGASAARAVTTAPPPPADAALSPPPPPTPPPSPPTATNGHRRTLRYAWEQWHNTAHEFTCAQTSAIKRYDRYVATDDAAAYRVRPSDALRSGTRTRCALCTYLFVISPTPHLTAAGECGAMIGAHVQCIRADADERLGALPAASVAAVRRRQLAAVVAPAADDAIRRHVTRRHRQLPYSARKGGKESLQYKIADAFTCHSALRQRARRCLRQRRQHQTQCRALPPRPQRTPSVERTQCCDPAAPV